MKQIIAGMLTAAMLLTLGACGDGGAAGDGGDGGEGGTAPGTPVALSIGTASLGGNFFTMGAAMAAVVMDNTGYNVTAQATGGSAANADAVHRKELDLGMSQATVISSAVAGTDQFDGEPLEDIRTLLNYSATPLHALVRKSVGAKGITDLKGAKIECLAPGDGIEISTKKILPALGLAIEDVKLEYSGNRVQAASRLKTGQVDAILDATGVGASWIADVVGDGSDFVLLNLTENEIAALCKSFPEMSPMKIPEESYKGQSGEIATVGNWTTVFCREDMDDEVAYNIVKSIYEKKEELVKAHNFFADLAPENIADACVAPLHPGAEKYYKEAGVL